MFILCCADKNIRERWSQGIANSSKVCEVLSYSQLMCCLRDTTPELILLHLNLPGLDGFDGVLNLRMDQPDHRLFVLSNKPSDEEGLSLFKTGIRGYANTYIDPRLLAKAVEVVRSGEVWVGRRLMTRLIEQSGRSARRRGDVESRRLLGLLTEREREIALLVGRGASNKQIANKLDITERTVKAHISSIFEKIGAQDRLQLALLVNGHCN